MRNAVRRGNMHCDAHRIEPFYEPLVTSAMSRESFLQSLIENYAKPFGKPVEQSRGGGVVIAVWRVVILFDQAKVQIPLAHRRFAPVQPFHGARRGGKWGKARRAAQSFLRATVCDINPGGIGIYGNPAERSDAIRDHQRAGIVRGRRYRFAVLQRASRCFGMYECHDMWLRALNKFRRFLIGERLTPGLLAARDLRALAAAHLAQTVAEVSSDEYGETRIGFDKIRDRERVRCAERLTEAVANFSGNFKEIRIEITDDRLRHRFVYGGFHHGGSGPKEKPFR